MMIHVWLELNRYNTLITRSLEIDLPVIPKTGEVIKIPNSMLGHGWGTMKLVPFGVDSVTHVISDSTKQFSHVTIKATAHGIRD